MENEAKFEELAKYLFDLRKSNLLEIGINCIDDESFYGSGLYEEKRIKNEVFDLVCEKVEEIEAA